MEAGRPYSRLLDRLARTTQLMPDDHQLISALPLSVANYADREDVLRNGETPRCTLLLKGYLCGHKRVAGSRRQITSLMVPGDITHFNSMQWQHTDHTLSALGPVVVAFIPLSAFTQMLQRSPRLSQAFWHETFIEAAILREWIANLGRREALARVAHVLCEIAMRLQTVGLASNYQFTIPWTQMDVADVCGISVVHANRVVQDLRRMNLIEWEQKTLRIIDWDRLAQVGDFTGDYLQLHQPPLTSLPDHYVASNASLATPRDAMSVGYR